MNASNHYLDKLKYLLCFRLLVTEISCTFWPTFVQGKIKKKNIWLKVLTMVFLIPALAPSYSCNQVESKALSRQENTSIIRILLLL